MHPRREIVAAYGYGDLFKVPSVMVITAMVDAKSRPKDQDEQRQKKDSNSFDTIFKKACDDLQMKDGVSYHTSGYTKAAEGFDYNYLKHEYV